MTLDKKASVELEHLRKILTGPLAEDNEARDEKILEIIRNEMSATAERLDRLEARLEDISTLVETHRRGILAEVGEAIATLGDRDKRQATDPKTEDPQDDVPDLAVGDKTG